MATAKQVETSLLTEHFGWTPISFIDEVINTVNEIIARATDSIESALLSADAGRDLGFAAKAAAENKILDIETDEDGEQMEVSVDKSRKEIEEGVLKLETLLEDTVDKNFDKWEIWVLRNVLSLGEWEGENVGWIRLGGYEELVLPNSAPTLDTPPVTPESLMTLRRKLLETQKLHNVLVAEKARNAAVLDQIRSLLTPQGLQTSAIKSESTSPGTSSQPNNGTLKPDFSFITQPPAPSTSSLNSQTSFPLTQLPLLKQHLDKLKPYLASLPADAGQAKTEAAIRAKERTDYIESQTRRILERRGVDVREGVSGGIGESRGEGEVQALEEVVDIMTQKTQNEVPAAEETEAQDEKMDVDE